MGSVTPTLAAEIRSVCTELQARPPLGFLQRQSRPDVPVDEPVEMEMQLVIKFAFHSSSPEHRTEPVEKVVEHRCTPLLRNR
jgi:hypothetical protein